MVRGGSCGRSRSAEPRIAAASRMAVSRNHWLRNRASKPHGDPGSIRTRPAGRDEFSARPTLDRGRPFAKLCGETQAGALSVGGLCSDERYAHLLAWKRLLPLPGLSHDVRGRCSRLRSTRQGSTNDFVPRRHCARTASASGGLADSRSSRTRPYMDKMRLRPRPVEIEGIGPPLTRVFSDELSWREMEKQVAHAYCSLAPEDCARGDHDPKLW